jgi:hypothetical protein
MRARLFLGLVLLASSARALEWDKMAISTTPEPGAEVVRAKFEYRNPAQKTVRILEVRTSCGCTEATPTASEVGPGGSGTMFVLFTIGARSGLQEKEIIILSDDSNVPTRLTLKVNLPPPAKKG